MSPSEQVLNVVGAHPGMTTIEYAAILGWQPIVALTQLWNLEVQGRLRVETWKTGGLSEPRFARWWPVTVGRAA